MESDADPRKRSAPPRRRAPLARGNRRSAPVEAEKPHSGPYYFQVHFQPVPGARKALFLALQPQLSQHLQAMMHAGQLLFSGGYPTSIGGMWLLKVKCRAEAERLVQLHPAVSGHMLTWRLLELQEPAGLVVLQDPTPHRETTKSDE